MEMIGINLAREMENVYRPNALSVHTIPSHQIHISTPSITCSLISSGFSIPHKKKNPYFVSLHLLSKCITLFQFNIFWHIAFSFFCPPSLHLAFLPLSFSCAVPVPFCPSGVWDSRQCWEAYGLLIRRQGGTRTLLTRAHTQTFALLCL